MSARNYGACGLAVVANRYCFPSVNDSRTRKDVLDVCIETLESKPPTGNPITEEIRAYGGKWEAAVAIDRSILNSAPRLDKGRFAAVFERARRGVVQMTPSELQLFIEGSEAVGRVDLSPPLPGFGRVASAPQRWRKLAWRNRSSSD